MCIDYNIGILHQFYTFYSHYEFTPNDPNFTIVLVILPVCMLFSGYAGKLPIKLIIGEPKSRILQNDRKIAPERSTAEFLYTGSLNSA